MKRFATKTLVMTAALAAFALGASAQSMDAEIPFTFRAGNAILAPGTYHITVSGANTTVLRLSNVETMKTSMIVPRYRSEVRKVGHDPKLWFSCTGSNCVLTSLWNGQDATTLVIGSPSGRGKEVAETRVVNLSFSKAE